MSKIFFMAKAISKKRGITFKEAYKRAKIISYYVEKRLKK